MNFAKTARLDLRGKGPRRIRQPGGAASPAPSQVKRLREPEGIDAGRRRDGELGVLARVAHIHETLEPGPIGVALLGQRGSPLRLEPREGALQA